jgi:hypothetical protein
VPPVVSLGLLRGCVQRGQQRVRYRSACSPRSVPWGPRWTQGQRETRRPEPATQAAWGHRGGSGAPHRRLGSLPIPAWSWAVQRAPARRGGTLEGPLVAAGVPWSLEARAAAGAERWWLPVRHWSRGRFPGQRRFRARYSRRSRRQSSTAWWSTASRTSCPTVAPRAVGTLVAPMAPRKPGRPVDAFGALPVAERVIRAAIEASDASCRSASNRSSHDLTGSTVDA